jgi:predicted DCC family thiol-disulfide oxidoreductase YuxK
LLAQALQPGIRDGSKIVGVDKFAKRREQMSDMHPVPAAPLGAGRTDGTASDVPAADTRPSDARAAGVQACLTVFHDGSCPLCQREIALAKSLTGGVGVAFRDVSALAGGEVAPGLTAHDAMKRFHMQRADGTLISGAAAFLEMWSASPRLRFMKTIQNSPRAVAALDRLYGAFLVVRPWLSRGLGRYDAWRKGQS